MKNKIACILISLLPLVSACEYNYAHYDEQTRTTPVSFKQDVLPIFTDNCTACHNSSSNPPDLRKENAYNALMNNNYINMGNAASSKLMIQIYDGHPDADALHYNEKTTILKWIQEGAQEN